MDVIKTEPEVVPLTIQSCDDAVKEESQPSPDDRNSLDQHVTATKEEYVNQSPELLSDIKEEREPNPVSFSMMKREPEERNVLYQLVAGIKEEYVDHNQDLTSEIKFEGNPEPISFPVVKREPEQKVSFQRIFIEKCKPFMMAVDVSTVNRWANSCREGETGTSDLHDKQRVGRSVTATKTKRQSMEYRHKDSPQKKKFKTHHSAGKLMGTVFQDADGVTHVNFLERGTTTNSERYMTTL
ncbi:uncharacterized protein [Periplaneta americana]|uniref:uncharacterized protein n=1 Tax=Periplaneta americana TaxID=6978 RepID=UPI0037E80EAE